jgi:hypothetical protein
MAMYLARFSYNIKPVDRDTAMDLLGREVAAATGQGYAARLLVPLTRSPGGAALQVEVEFDSLDAFDRYRDEGLGSAGDTRSWIRELSDILLEPPAVELLRSADGPSARQGNQQSSEEEVGTTRRGLIGGTVHKA